MRCRWQYTRTVAVLHYLLACCAAAGCVQSMKRRRARHLRVASGREGCGRRGAKLNRINIMAMRRRGSFSYEFHPGRRRRRETTLLWLPHLTATCPRSFKAKLTAFSSSSKGKGTLLTADVMTHLNKWYSLRSYFLISSRFKESMGSYTADVWYLRRVC